MRAGKRDGLQLTDPASTIPNRIKSLLSCLRARWSRNTESTFRRRLFERSEFLSYLDSGRTRRNPGEPAFEQARRGHARAEMVLVPFAETKGTRRAGTKPRIYNQGRIDHQKHEPLHGKKETCTLLFSNFLFYRPIPPTPRRLNSQSVTGTNI